MPIALATVFNILAVAVGLYSIIVLVRVMMTWLPGVEFGRIGDAIRIITDPFLAIFRKIRFLRFAGIDFSVLGAFISLNVLSTLFTYLAQANRVSFSAILIILIEVIGSGAGFILWFFLILVLLRLAGVVFRLTSFQNLWTNLDAVFQPLVHPIVRRLFPKRIIPYGTVLMGTGVTLLVAIGLLRLLVIGLALLAGLIPF